MTDSAGLPKELFTYLEDLGRNNTREFWSTNKHMWEQAVKAPMEALLADLSGDFPPLRLFRPQRDLRYTKDKSPYKLFTGATSDATAVGGSGYHLHIDADGLTIACGAMLMSPAELGRFRMAIDDPRSGASFSHLCASLAAASLPVGAGLKPALKRTPAGFSAEHPRSQFLRWKGAAMEAEFETSAWMHTPELADRIRTAWHGAAPFMEWMNTHVSNDVRGP